MPVTDPLSDRDSVMLSVTDTVVVGVAVDVPVFDTVAVTDLVNVTLLVCDPVGDRVIDEDRVTVFVIVCVGVTVTVTV